MQHVRPVESRPPTPAIGEAGAARVNAVTGFTAQVQQTDSAAEGLDFWSLLDECYREHMARRQLEELFAAGEMSALEY